MTSHPFHICLCLLVATPLAIAQLDLGDLLESVKSELPKEELAKVEEKAKSAFENLKAEGKEADVKSILNELKAGGVAKVDDVEKELKKIADDVKNGPSCKEMKCDKGKVCILGSSCVNKKCEIKPVCMTEKEIEGNIAKLKKTITSKLTPEQKKMFETNMGEAEKMLKKEEMQGEFMALLKSYEGADMSPENVENMKGDMVKLIGGSSAEPEGEKDEKKKAEDGEKKPPGEDTKSKSGETKPKDKGAEVKPVDQPPTGNNKDKAPGSSMQEKLQNNAAPRNDAQNQGSETGKDNKQVKRNGAPGLTHLHALAMLIAALLLLAFF